MCTAGILLVYTFDILHCMNITLVTGNANKLEEWQQLTAGKATLDSIDLDIEELQSDDPLAIVTDKVKKAFKAVGKPVIVEDVSAALEKHGGLPGPFIKYYMKNIGKDALYQLAGGEGEHATVSCSAAYYDGTSLITVRGVVHGTVVAPRGDAYGFNITFVPEGETETFAEMSSEKKNTMSHRALAVQLLLEKLEAL